MSAEPVARPTNEQRITAALWFAEHGFGVFGCWSTRDDGKCRCPLGADCDSAGKHPNTEHGFQEATRDPKAITTFLSARSQPNYGLVCPEGVFALDVDGDGIAHLAELEALYGPLPPTLRTDTANGQHVFLRWPDGLPRPLKKMFGYVTRWGSGKTAGYVIGPNSVHASGKVYRSAANAVADIALLPETWAQAAVTPDTDHITVTAGDDPAQIKIGGRHDWLRDRARFYSGSIRDAGVLFAAVWAENLRLEDPKSEDEVRRAIGDALAKFPADETVTDPDTGETRRAPRIDSGDLLGDTSRAPFPDPPDRIAFGGLAGEIVSSVLDGTDCSEVGLLASLLAFAGVLAPSRCYVLGRTHVSALHVCLVGDTSDGRKTTAMDRTQDTVKAALGSTVVNKVVMTGTNSGEALVTAMERRQLENKREPAAALVYEEEYASLLAAVSREGSTLDARLRGAFDSTQAMANRKSLGAQIVQPPYWLAALVGITPHELQAKAPTGMLRSGSANRWLWLPVVGRDEGGDWPPAPMLALRDAFAAAHDKAWEEPRVLGVHEDARSMLSAYRAHLRRAAKGQAVDLSQRYPTIAVRVAMIHATLDGDDTISLEHVRRAIALTEYAHEGVPWAWGYAVGDELATFLLRDLVESGELTKHQITQRWCRDQMRAQRVIDELRRLRFVETVTVGTAGRPRTVVRILPDHAAFVRFVHQTVTQPRERKNPQRSNESQKSHETHEMHEMHESPPRGTCQGCGRTSHPGAPCAPVSADAMCPVCGSGPFVSADFYQRHWQSEHLS